MWRTTTRALLLGALAALALAGTAQAKQIQQYFYSGTSFEAGGSSPALVAFDSADQSVLVVATGDKGAGVKVSKFHLDGAPAPFGDLAGEPTSFHTGEAIVGTASVAIAVDESGGASTGNFYLASSDSAFEAGKVYGYSPGGTPLAGYPLSLGGTPCGIDVAPNGNVWVANARLGVYKELTPSGNPTGRFLSFGGTHGGCPIAIDSTGSVYLIKNERVVKYDSELHFLGDLGPSVAQGPSLDFDRSEDFLFELFSFGANPIAQADSSGNPLIAFGGPDPTHFYTGLEDRAKDLAVNPQTHGVYVLKDDEVDIFSRDPSLVTVPSATTGGAEDLSATSATLTGTLDPDGAETVACRFEWGTTPAYGEVLPCSQGDVFGGASGINAITAELSGLTKGTVYHFRLAAENANGVLGFGRDQELGAADPPVIGEAGADHITSDSARINLAIKTEGGDTDYHVEIGTDASYGTSVPIPDARLFARRPIIGASGGPEGYEVILAPQAKAQGVRGLSPETQYHYRVVAENPAGIVESPDQTFKTFALPSSGADACPNAQARQQTSAAGLLDCRAYELVSAGFTGGYDVRSDLSPGITPIATSPTAKGTTLYSMRAGTIPGIAGHPTNRGADPYLATRGASGWSTRYVGIPADNPNATDPFASPLLAFDNALDTFAFGGAEICEPCFSDGSTNVPLRLPDGSLQQGVAGTSPGPAEGAGEVRKPLSAGGTHFVFGSKAQLESDANSNGADLTLYERDLNTKTTQVISKLPNGDTIANGEGLAELDVSKDGSRVVIGEVISTDPEGNRYYHLYLHVGNSPSTIDLTPGATDGALYAGMSEDGSTIYFTTRDALTTASDQDTDTSVDLYRDDIEAQSATLARVSVGAGAGDTDNCDPAANSYNTSDWNTILGGPTDCSVLAIGGGGGVASGAGSIYFLSPEQLDGSSGTQDAPNLYLASPGESPQFIATLESSASSPLKAGAHVFRSSFGSFVNPEGVAIDAANGDIYVLDNLETLASEGAFVQKFNSEGNPITSFGNNGKIDGTGSPTGPFLQRGAFSPVGLPSQVAVDNTPASPNNGDLYVPDFFNGVIDRFSSSGAYESQISSGLPVAVAVNPTNGNVYVANLFGTVEIYEPDGDFVASFEELGFGAKGLAVDSTGTFYVASAEGTAVYNSSGSFVETLAPSPAYGVAIDPADGHVYVDQVEEIVEFDPTGTQVGTSFGKGVLSQSVGLAVNAGQVAASNRGAGKVSLFGAPQPPPDPSYDSPLVIDSVRTSRTRHADEFQLTPNGEVAVFISTLPLDGFNSAGKYEVYRYDSDEDVVRCVSCSPTTARPLGDAALTPYGSSLTDDGRVFFTTGEALTLRDSNEKADAYEWSDGKQELVSTGTDSNDSALLSVSSDGTDAFFFTRQKLVPEDENGSSVRLYTAREGGGFAFGPPQFQCAASDECHGVSTPAAPPLAAGTTAGTPGQFKGEGKPKCRKGKVRRRGKCVSRHSHKHQHKRAKAKRGGGK